MLSFQRNRLIGLFCEVNICAQINISNFEILELIILLKYMLTVWPNIYIYIYIYINV